MLLRLSLKFSLISLTVMAILIVSARAIASPTPPDPLVNVFGLDCEDHATSCLFGVVADVTKLPEAKAELIKNGFEPLDDYRWVNRTTNCMITLYDTGNGWEADHFIVHNVELSNLYECSNLRLSDLIAKYGDVINLIFVSPFNIGGEFKKGGVLTLERGIIVAAVLDNRLGGWFSPESRIISFSAYNVGPFELSGSPWYGFSTRAAYCRRFIYIPDVCL